MFSVCVAGLVCPFRQRFVQQTVCCVALASQFRWRRASEPEAGRTTTAVAQTPQVRLPSRKECVMAPRHFAECSPLVSRPQRRLLNELLAVREWVAVLESIAGPVKSCILLRVSPAVRRGAPKLGSARRTSRTARKQPDVTNTANLAVLLALSDRTAAALSSSGDSLWALGASRSSSPQQRACSCCRLRMLPRCASAQRRARTASARARAAGQPNATPPAATPPAPRARRTRFPSCSSACRARLAST